MTDTNRPKERRLHPRYTAPGRIELAVGDGEAAVLKDISLSGVACVSPKAFEEMTVLDVRMSLPVDDEQVEFQAGGAVVRSEARPDGGHLVAIFFTHMDEGSRQQLERFLAAQGD